MPWKVRAGGPSCPFEVVRSDTGKRVACHPTRKKAEAHIRALYANEPDAAGKAVEPMQVVTKSVDAAIEPVESESPNGKALVVLSTEALDRDGEHLWIDEWKQPLPERIHIDGDHGRSIEKTVGSAVPRIEGNRLLGEIDYAGTEYAQMVRQLVNEGHINKLSVTYAEHKNQKDNSVQRELLNAAFVAIPANPEAMVLASKAAKFEDKANGLGASGNNPQVKHDDMVQAIHDAACHLGAQCMNEIEADSGAADGANKSVTTSGTSSITKTLSTEELHDGTALKWTTETSSSKDAGQPQEQSTEEPTAPTADKAAGTADQSADDAVKAKAARVRALAYLIKQNSLREET